ncbi:MULTISPECIES: hypothetical protein [unclassified Microbacterium]|uniref:hypothetical protein n=1 Tax=unclassified Microbacterium TaxID=2609290 RepID=UPI0009775DA8|nr:MULTISPECIES: hypothetical protein [unclassified Microbacterium]
MGESIERVQLTVGDATYPLAPLEAVKEIEAQVLGATRAGGGFLRVTTDGGQRLSIFVTPTTSIVIASNTVMLEGAEADGDASTRHAQPPDMFGEGDTPYDYI